MLTGAGFSDDALFSHGLRQQGLAENIIDFMRAGMREVFALKIDCGAFEIFGEPAGEIKARGTPNEIAKIIVEILLELGVGFCLGVFRFELAAG